MVSLSLLGSRVQKVMERWGEGRLSVPGKTQTTHIIFDHWNKIENDTIILNGILPLLWEKGPNAYHTTIYHCQCRSDIASVIPNGSLSLLYCNRELMLITLDETTISLDLSLVDSSLWGGHSSFWLIPLSGWFFFSGWFPFLVHFSFCWLIPLSGWFLFLQLIPLSNWFSSLVDLFIWSIQICGWFLFL